MIILTRELENELPQMTADELKNRFTPEEMKELNKQLAIKIAENEKIVAELEKRIADGKQFVLKKYGPKPLIYVTLDGEDETSIGLYIDGEINIFPETIGIFDTFEIVDLIGHLLHIPKKRQLVDSKLHNYKGFINRTPLSQIDCRVYARKVTRWLCDDVEPKPKIYWPGKTLYSIMDRILKGVGV